MKNTWVSVLSLLLTSVVIAAGDTGTLRVQPDKVVRTLDRKRLLGTNIGLWHEARQLFDADIRHYLRELSPAFLRIPGGSWSDEYYWNGNGVFNGSTFDLTKLKDGIWDVDFSGYAPGFRVQGDDRRPAVDFFHGNVDVLALHEFAKDKGAHSIVTVNCGSGTAALAAEWVRWANLKNGYGVRYWEIGNELEGQWELGHFLSDGSEMTGAIYAKRFIAFAKAMKAVDPTIKIGGAAASNDKGGFTEDLLRLAGDHVDFISFHTYPVEKHLDSDQQIFDQALSLRTAMDRFRGWIAQYQPARKDEIEIAITEWNSKVIEDRDSADLINGLWTCVFVGEMFQSGVSFATQWDLLTMTEEGGHGMFHFKGHCIPKSQYWGLYLWSKYMGDTVLASSLDGTDHAYTAVTRSSDRLHVMVVNTSRGADLNLALDAPGIAFGAQGCMATLSQREYSWNFIKHEPLWSYAPEPEPIVLTPGFKLHVPPFSARVFELPFEGATLDRADGQKSDSEALRILLPESAPADLPVEGWVLVGQGGADALSTSAGATLNVSGPARADSKQVRISEAAGRFFLEPSGTGDVTVRVTSEGISAQATVKLVAVKERPEVYWRFENDVVDWGATSSFDLRADDLVRPNQQVAAVDLRAAVPAENHDELMVLNTIPAGLDRKRIGGVVFDLHVGSGLVSADDDLAVGVILQSESAHWIPLGAIPLKQVKGKWQSFTFRLPDPKFHRAVSKTYALRFQLFQRGAEKVPVDGTVYLDNVGFLLR